MITKKAQIPLNDGDNHRCPEAEVADRNNPLRFWEIDHFFKCPVVGMCLTFSEQKQLLKKVGISIKRKTPFEIHEMLVASSENENRLSKRADRMLNRKFNKDVASFSGLRHEEFKSRFKEAFESGDCTGALWAAAISPILPIETKREFFGDIHMTMHWTGEQSVKLKQRLTRRENELADLHQRVQDAKRHRQSLQKENRRLKQSHGDLMIKLAVHKQKNVKLEEKLADGENHRRMTELEQENRSLNEKVFALQASAENYQVRMALLEKRNMHLSSELTWQKDSNRRFLKKAKEIIGDVFALNRCDRTCPSFDLCKKRILIVGGITRMESLYRELIESNGGIFEYHDGYMKKGAKTLESRLRRADMVVCPVNCNSHAACSIVKNLAKKHHKTVHMLASSSLNAVSQVIWGTTDGATIN